MATRDQDLSCTIGDSFTFGITILPYEDGSMPDLVGAIPRWCLQEGNFTDAAILIDKNGPPHIFVTQDDAGNWVVNIELEPEDTTGLVRGRYYHTCKLTLASGVVSHVASGGFFLATSAIP
jgi:hypothetical protein